MDKPNGDCAASQADAAATLVLVMDIRTLQVSIGGAAMPINVAQYIVDEAARLLAEQRRLAAAMQLQQNMAAQRATQAIRESLKM